MGSLLRVATDVDIRIINSETSIRCMAKYGRRKETIMGIIKLSETGMTFRRK